MKFQVPIYLRYTYYQLSPLPLSTFPFHRYLNLLKESCQPHTNQQQFKKQPASNSVNHMMSDHILL